MHTRLPIGVRTPLRDADRRPRVVVKDACRRPACSPVRCSLPLSTSICCPPITSVTPGQPLNVVLILTVSPTSNRLTLFRIPALNFLARTTASPSSDRQSGPRAGFLLHGHLVAADQRPLTCTVPPHAGRRVSRAAHHRGSALRWVRQSRWSRHQAATRRVPADTPAGGLPRRSSRARRSSHRPPRRCRATFEAGCPT